MPQLAVDCPRTVEKDYHELDYIEWLKTFDQFHEISRYCKYGCLAALGLKTVFLDLFHTRLNTV